MKLTNYKVLCMTGLLALSAVVVQAQDVIVTPKTKTKPETTTTTPKQKQKTTRKKQPAPVIDHPVISETFIVNGVSFKMIYVEGGTFTMGATPELGNETLHANPAHNVTLSSYYIGETEVTQALWKAVMGNNPSYYKGNNRPVDCVTWEECQAFINKLNTMTGKDFHLPTEAEWEFAARGGIYSKGYKYSGSNNLDDFAWYGENSDHKPHPVKTKYPNELGIYDMSGNVWEWCQDWYSSYTDSSQVNPKGPSSGDVRVVRSGGCVYMESFYLIANRFSEGPNQQSANHGLRIALSVTPQKQSLEQPAQQQASAETPAESKQIFTVKDVSFKMISLEGGTFTMGATSEQGSDANDNEKPAHRVTLSSYYIGETEVTQALWKAVMGNNPSKFKGDYLPVECVSWDDCWTFINKLNSITGKNFRLPTEAEWEFAARGGNRSQGYKYSGSNNIDSVAWYLRNSGKGTHFVKTKAPNELGVYDMSGNVFEWCIDLYGSYSSESQTNPLGFSSGFERVLRGGCWDIYPWSCRVSYRLSHASDHLNHFSGFRLALDK